MKILITILSIVAFSSCSIFYNPINDTSKRAVKAYALSPSEVAMLDHLYGPAVRNEVAARIYLCEKVYLPGLDFDPPSYFDGLTNTIWITYTENKTDRINWIVHETCHYWQANYMFLHALPMVTKFSSYAMSVSLLEAILDHGQGTLEQEAVIAQVYAYKYLQGAPTYNDAGTDPEMIPLAYTYLKNVLKLKGEDF